MLVSFFARQGLTGMSFVAGVFADDHAFVDLVLRADEEAAAFLDHVERVGGG